MKIIGAGMAGLLAANMLRRYSPYVQEAQASLPDNHGALLRFRSDAVARATGQNFKKVRVLKAIKGFDGQLRTTATLRESNKYSFKVTGEVMSRSVMNLEPSDRYIAPDDFIETMARGTNIGFEDPLTTEQIAEQVLETPTPLISTIPMPLLMKIVDWKDVPEFKYRGIWSVVAEITKPVINSYQTIYYPDAEPYYRASLTGGKLTVEFNSLGNSESFFEPKKVDWMIEEILNDFGIRPDLCTYTFKAKYQQYGKLLPIDEKARRSFILAMTDQYRIYSVGRFATWRQILMDDVVQDVERVQGWISDRDDYSRALHSGH